MTQQLEMKFGDMTVIPAASFAAEPAEQIQPWLVENVLCYNGVGIVGAPPKAGKTWLVIDLALSVASGKPFLDHFPVHAQGGALIFSPEGSRPELHRRIRQNARMRGIDLMHTPLNELRCDSLDLHRPDAREWMEKAVAEKNPTLLVIDPFVNCFNGDIVSHSSVRPVLNFFTGLKNRYGTTVLITHHFAKDAKPDGSGLLGADAFRQWYDSAMFIGADTQGRKYLGFDQRSAPPADKTPIRFETAAAGCRYVVDVDRKDGKEDREKDLAHKALLHLRATPGLWLPIDAIRSALNSGMGAVQKVLKMLVTEGLAEHNLKKGYRAKLMKKNQADRLAPSLVPPPVSQPGKTEAVNG